MSENWRDSRRKKYDNICMECQDKELKGIYGSPRVIDKGSFVIIEGEGPAPKISVKRGHEPPSVMQMAEATEIFRINKMLTLCNTGKSDKVKRKAIEYLLKCWDKLPAEQGAEVINHANLMLGSRNTDDDVKVSIAMAMKNFIGVKDSRKDSEVSFEQMIKSGGKIKIDTGEWKEKNDE